MSDMKINLPLLLEILKEKDWAKGMKEKEADGKFKIF